MSDPVDPLSLPDGVINAEPTGAWQSEEAAESEADHSAPTAPAGPIEGSVAGGDADADLVGDADLEQGRSDDPSLDPDARRRQEGL